VLGGTIRARGAGAGIGSGGEGGETGLLAFHGTAALICNASAGKFPVNASSIVLSDASLIFGTESDRLFGVSPWRAGWLNLTIVYGKATSARTERLSDLNASILQIGNLSFNLPMGLYVSAASPCTFCVSRAGDVECIVRHSTEVSEFKSAVFSLPSDGSYSIRALLADWTGVFETLEGVLSYNLSSNFSFVEEARLAWRSPTPTPPPTLTALAVASAYASPSSPTSFTVRFDASRLIATLAIPVSSDSAVSQAVAETSVLPSSAGFSPSAFRCSRHFPLSAPARTSRLPLTADPLASQPCDFTDAQSMYSIILATVQPESDNGQGTSVDIGLIVGVEVGGVLALVLAVTAGLAVLVRGLRVGKGASSPRGSDSDEGTSHAMDRIHTETVFSSLLRPVLDGAMPTRRKRELWNFSDDFSVSRDGARSSFV
jgi:hypothetical protein